MKNKKPFELFQEIQGCRGTTFLNSLHMRSFSLNILQRNALELMEEAKKVQDPDFGIPLMATDNREAGNQAHRELSRHLHNFLSAAKTLVDHTRVFIDEYYSESDLIEEHNENIKATFSNDANSKFVHDLRNYMLHKGPPRTSMFFSFTNNTTTTKKQSEVETGIRFETKSLLEWSKWTAPAKRYIEDSGEYISIHDFTESYLNRVNTFHENLEARLYRYHADDLKKLEELRRAYMHAEDVERTTKIDSIQVQETAAALATPGTAYLEELSFSEEESESLDEICRQLIANLQIICRPEDRIEKFPTERPIEATLKDTDLLDEPVYRGYDKYDRPYIAFIRKDKNIYGLLERDREQIGEICGAVLTKSWAQAKISNEFIEKELIKWARSIFHKTNTSNFSKEILLAAKKGIKKLEVIIPIAHLEIESAFNFGSIRVEPIGRERIEGIRGIASKIKSAQEESINQFIEKIRKDFQGYAAFIIDIEAEESAAMERCLKIAQIGIDILRFFSPAAPYADTLSPTALLGSEILPRSRVLALSDASFRMTESLTSGSIEFWRASNLDIGRLKKAGLEQAGHLIIPDNLNDFEKNLRSALMKYSKSLIQTDAIDRLNYTIAAIESILLKHEIEPIAASIANRLSYIFSKTNEDRTKYGKISRQAYKIRDKHKSLFRSPQEDLIISQFTEMVYRVLCNALTNTHAFRTKCSYIEAVDFLKKQSAQNNN